MKTSKFQQALMARSLPPNAMDVLDELASRLVASSRGTFPPGILGSVGAALEGVLSEVKQVKALKAQGKAKKADEAE